jgi:hypothetical protein
MAACSQASDKSGSLTGKQPQSLLHRYGQRYRLREPELDQRLTRN